MVTESTIHGEWLRAQVREILLEADPSAWRAEREADLRRRVRDVVAYLRQRGGDHLDVQAGIVVSPVRERAGRLMDAMERALPAEATRSRWAAFVSSVHPEYEAFVDALGQGVAPTPSVRPTNYARSAFHLASAGIAVGCVACFSRPVLIGVASAFVTYAWSMEIARRVFPKLNDSLMRAYGKVAHPHERYRVNSATWYATALILLASFATRPAMLAGCAVLGVADPIAASVGRRFGRHRIRAGRSVEGTTAFVVSGTLAAALVLWMTSAVTWPHLAAFALISGVVGGLAELFSIRLDDNFTIPVAIGIVTTALGSFLG